MQTDKIVLLQRALTESDDKSNKSNVKKEGWALVKEKQIKDINHDELFKESKERLNALRSVTPKKGSTKILRDSISQKTLKEKHRSLHTLDSIHDKWCTDDIDVSFINNVFNPKATHNDFELNYSGSTEDIKHNAVIAEDSLAQQWRDLHKFNIPNPEKVVREERRLSMDSVHCVQSLIPPKEPEPEEIVAKLIKQRRASTIRTLSDTIKQIFIEKKIKDDGIPALIVDSIYIGSIGAAHNLAWLKSHEITHVLCVAGGIGACFPKQFVYHIIDINDAAHEDISCHFKRCYQFIESALNDSGKCLIHCFAGMSRSVTVTAAYLMQKQHIGAVSALKLVKKARSVANPNAGFILQLIKFQQVVANGNGNKIKNNDQDEDKDEDKLSLTSPNALAKLETGRRPSLFTALAKLRGMKNRSREQSTDDRENNNLSANTYQRIRRSQRNNRKYSGLALLKEKHTEDINPDELLSKEQLSSTSSKKGSEQILQKTQKATVEVEEKVHTTKIDSNEILWRNEPKYTTKTVSPLKQIQANDLIMKKVLCALRKRICSDDKYDKMDDLMLVYPNNQNNHTQIPNQQQNNNRNNSKKDDDTSNNDNCNNNNNNHGSNGSNASGSGYGQNGSNNDGNNNNNDDSNNNRNDGDDADEIDEIDEIDEDEIEQIIVFLMNEVQHCDDAKVSNVLRSFSNENVEKVINAIEELEEQRVRIKEIISRKGTKSNKSIEDRYTKQIKQLQQQIENQKLELSAAQSQIQIIQQVANNTAITHRTEMHQIRVNMEKKIHNMYFIMEQQRKLKAQQIHTLKQDLVQKHDEIAAASYERDEIPAASNIKQKKTASTPSKSKHKRKKQNNTNMNIQNYVYVPLRTKDKYQMYKTFTGKRIPSKIVDMQVAHNMIYDYMHQYIAINKNNSYKNISDTLEIFNFGLRSNESNEIAYFIAKLKHPTKRKRYQWLINEILTESQIMETYNDIVADELPNIQYIEFSAEMKEVEQELMRCKEQIIKDTKWTQVNIYKKENNKRRLELKLTMKEFKENYTKWIKIEKDIELVPIVMFDHNDVVYIQYIWIISLEQNIDIGVALNYNPSSHKIKVTGIHLDKELMYKHHHILCSSHSCQHLNDFKSCINYMHIGNCDDQKNGMRALKQQLVDLQKQFSEKSTSVHGYDSSSSIPSSVSS